RMSKRRTNNEGTIYERSNGRWCGQLTVFGHRETFCGLTQQEVQDKLLARRNELRLGAEPAADFTVAELTERWWAVVRNSYVFTSHYIYSRDMTRIKHYLGPCIGHDLTDVQIGQLYAAMEKDHVRPSVRLSTAIRLRQILEHARKAGSL